MPVPELRPGRATGSRPVSGDCGPSAPAGRHCAAAKPAPAGDKARIDLQLGMPSTADPDSARQRQAPGAPGGIGWGAMSQPPLRDPGPAKPDTSDWTWVLARPCPECGFAAASVAPADVPGLVRDAGARFAAVLARRDVRSRPTPEVWSPLEYACHVRDVCQVMGSRVELIMSGDGRTPVTFANWDQDTTALEAEYWRGDPARVSQEVRSAADSAADSFAKVRSEQWSWPALRSNGSTFTALTLGRYFVHELQHHLWDVRG